MSVARDEYTATLAAAVAGERAALAQLPSATAAFCHEAFSAPGQRVWTDPEGVPCSRRRFAGAAPAGRPHIWQWEAGDWWCAGACAAGGWSVSSYGPTPLDAFKRWKSGDPADRADKR